MHPEGHMFGYRPGRPRRVRSCPALCGNPLLGGRIISYSSVWSSISASGALFLTDSIPLSADCLRSYASLVAMTCPLLATRLKWNLPVDPFLSTNLPAMRPPRREHLTCWDDSHLAG